MGWGLVSNSDRGVMRCPVGTQVLQILVRFSEPERLIKNKYGHNNRLGYVHMAGRQFTLNKHCPFVLGDHFTENSRELYIDRILGVKLGCIISR